MSLQEFTPEGKYNLAKIIETNIEKLCSVKNSFPDAWFEVIETTSHAVNQFKSYQNGEVDTKISKILEESAVKLWNHAVPLKTQGSISNITNARLRNICFMVLIYSDNGSDVIHESLIKRQIIMGMKTARAWIECHQMESAENVLNITQQRAEKLLSLIIEKTNNSTPDTSNNNILSRHRLDIDRDIFKLLTYKAEVAASQMKNEAALQFILTAKEMLSKFPKETSYLSMVCYNFGVESYQHDHYEESIIWLKESYELGKGCLDPKGQARTLRLLANAYLEWDSKTYSDKAMNAVSLANTEYLHAAGLYLKLKILLIMNETITALNTVLHDIISHKDTSLDLNLNVLSLLRKHNRYDVDFPSKLLTKYENTTDYGRISTIHLEALLAGKYLQKAKDFSELVITGHNTGNVLEANIKKQFHHLFWEQAAVDFEGENYNEALQWYNYSYSLYSPAERSEGNMAKLQRNRASCLIYLSQYSQAEEILLDAERCSKTFSATYYLLYKLSLLQDKQETGMLILYKLSLLQDKQEAATSSLKKMVDCIKKDDISSQSTDLSLVCLAAQLALKLNCHDVATMAMECFIKSGDDEGQVLITIRCLIRLQLSLTETENHDRKVYDKLYELIMTAYNRLSNIQSKSDEDEKFVIQDEATWFMKIAWNLGLKCKDDPLKTKQFFTLCNQLLSLCGGDINNINRQKTCVLMSVFSSLQLARNTTDEDSRISMYQEVLQQITRFKQQAYVTDITWSDKSIKDNSDILLVLCEFEARIKLNDSTAADKLLENILSSSLTDSKTLEIIAAISIEPPANNRDLSVRALKIAIRTHLQSQQPDYARCSKDIHSLIQMSIGEVNNDSELKEATMNYYKETIDVIENRAKDDYPEMETVWLMTKAWNCGIYFYRFSNNTEAERWCGMALHLLSLLPSMKGNYEEKMNNVYSEILSTMDGHKPVTSPLEE